MHVDRINGERFVEGEQLSLLVLDISNALVDLGMLPIQDIPKLPKPVWEVLPAVGLVLECLQEALASDTGLWD
jgi:hypothetical protein